MRRTLTRAAIVGALVSGLLGAAVVPANAAVWSYKGRFQSYGDCSREGSAIVRGPQYSQYDCELNFDQSGGFYALWVR